MSACRLALHAPTVGTHGPARVPARSMPAWLSTLPALRHLDLAKCSKLDPATVTGLTQLEFLSLRVRAGWGWWVTHGLQAAGPALQHWRALLLD